MKYRLVGPFRGGRSLTASGVAGDPNTYYFGSTGGGVWKSTDGAMTWSPVFDKQTVGSIGSLAVAPSDPNVVYVGTGEACIRGNISHGDGIYKTVDGGKTWKNVGLRDSRAIGKVIVDPKNADVVLCGGAGPPFRAEHRARHLPHHRRRQDLGQGSVQGREHRRRSTLPSIRTTLTFFSRSLWEARRTPWGLRQRRPWQRAVSLGRWRKHVEAAGRTWPAQRVLRPHRPCCGREFRSRLRADRSARRAVFIAPTMAAKPGNW